MTLQEKHKQIMEAVTKFSKLENELYNLSKQIKFNSRYLKAKYNTVSHKLGKANEAVKKAGGKNPIHNNYILDRYVNGKLTVI